MKSSDAAPIPNPKVVPFRRSLPRGAAVEFLPAALEILETPASPTGRAIAATVILFFTVAVAWATFGRIDIIATASGKIVPTARTKAIQPLEPGVVSAIYVQDGEHVTAGQVLVELDRTITSADRKRIAHDLLGATLDVARLSALQTGIEMGSAQTTLLIAIDAPEREVAHTRAAMIAQAAEQNAKLASLDGQIAQKIAEGNEITETIAKLEASLPLIQQEAELRRQAMELQYGNRIADLEARERLVEQQHELIVQQRRTVETASARLAMEHQREQTVAEYAHKILSDLADAEQKVDELTEDLSKAEKKIEQQVLRSPVDGVVQQLAVHTIGGVVTPAQQLMMIVPADSRLEVEAMVSNRDIGFVHPGQATELKIDTFNFTRYGLLHGNVLTVSGDSIVRDKPKDKLDSSSSASSGELSESSEPQGQELVYSARVSVDRTQMQVEDKLVNLTPGMAITVEIKTGSRRVIEYLLSPLVRYKQSSLRER